jgi:radical SAM protein with 4Fe4S-binding SPASM domain
MTFNILRAKTIDLFAPPVTDKQKYNSWLNKNEAIDRKIKLKSYPRRIILELTNACNYDCVMCGRNGTPFRTAFLDIFCVDKLNHIIDYVEEVTLFGWGEPTLHPQFREFVKKFDGKTIRKYLLTNGSTLKKIKSLLFEYKIDIVAVSIDGATAETNNKIRKNANFNQIIENLEHIVTFKKQHNLMFPYINFVFTMMRSNINELPDLIKLANNIGIEEVKAVYLTAFTNELENEVLWGYKDMVKDIFEKSAEIAGKYEIKLKLPFLQGEDIAENKYHKDCYVGWRDFFIGADSYIRPCQSSSTKMLKFDKTLTFDEIWNSKEFQDFRLKVNDPKLMHANCKNCYQSSYANWNRREAFVCAENDFSTIWKGDNID